MSRHFVGGLCSAKLMTPFNIDKVTPFNAHYLLDFTRMVLPPERVGSDRFCARFSFQKGVICVIFIFFFASLFSFLHKRVSLYSFFYKRVFFVLNN